MRDLDVVRKSIGTVQPDYAIHMAAQPLVLRSYSDPIETYETNVTGTLNFLRALNELEARPTSLVVTTDKVYRDENKTEYVESDPLGGEDPYSASKAMADLLTQSWISTNPDLKLFVARAGNVIGSFDVSENRLVPDIQRAIYSGKPIEIRHPDSTRPWQHVLDCLSGYLMLLFKANESHFFPKVFNFGPSPGNIKPVEDLVAEAKKSIPSLQISNQSISASAKETKLLGLNSDRAHRLLGWHNLVDFETSVAWSLQPRSVESPLAHAQDQIERFLGLGARSWLES